ncbi:MAG: MlaD family protein [Bacteroidota bacterium]
MDKATGRTFRLGIMVIVGVVVFTTAAYLIGQKRDLFSNTFQLRAVFGNVNGLQPGNNVRFNGINVGSVLSITIQNDTTIEAVLRIKEKIRPFIKKNAFVSIGTDGLMGNMLVNINPGAGMAPPVEDNDLLKTYSRIKTDDILKTLNVTNENAALLTSNLLEMLLSVRHGKGIISYLLYDTLFTARLDRSIQNLASTTAKTNELMSTLQQVSADLEKGKGLAGWMLTDTVAQGQIVDALKQLNTASGRVEESAADLQLLMARWKQSEGAIPTLMTDTTMATHLRQTLTHLNSGIKKFDENMEALKYSFLTRRYFKKQAKNTQREK